MNHQAPPSRAGSAFSEPQPQQDDLFQKEIVQGLTAIPKSLPSKYLYDTRGDQIFQEIMELPEYYLTRCEEEILHNVREELLDHIRQRTAKFDLVELGAGDGKKTRLLLSHFLHRGATFRYLPVDISRHAIDELCAALAEEYPNLEVKGLTREYMMALDDLSASGGNAKMILFMGGNIGNFSKPEAVEFLSLLASRMNRNDLLLTGFDLKKDPNLIHNAYNDSRGVTKAFNFNLLRRINRQLDGNFDPSCFTHFPTYEPITGEMKSYLISAKEQTVRLDKPGVDIHFNAWEPVFMEVSNKYDLPEIERMAARAGLSIENKYFDAHGYYTNVLFYRS